MNDPPHASSALAHKAIELQAKLTAKDGISLPDPVLAVLCNREQTTLLQRSCTKNELTEAGRKKKPPERAAAMLR
jgi:hypothetical protein